MMLPVVYMFTLLFIVIGISKFVEYKSYIKMSKDSMRAGKYITSGLGWIFLALTVLAIGMRI